MQDSMKWILLAAGIFGLALIIRVQIVSWAVTPIRYAGLNADDLQRFVRSWGFYLEDRAHFTVVHREVFGHAQFERRRYKTKPDLLSFRVPFSNLAKEQRENVKTAFSRSDITFSMELTPKKKRDRALTVEMEADDSMLPVKGVRCVVLAFEALGAADSHGYSVSCFGRMTSPIVDGPELIPWRRDFEVGRRLGAALGRLLHGN